MSVGSAALPFDKVGKMTRAVVLWNVMVRVFFLSVLLFVPQLAWADSPADVTKRLISTMQSCGKAFGSPDAPSLCTNEEIEKNLAIAQLARWLMGPHWDKIGQEKQTDFVGLLARLLRELAYPRASEFLAGTQFQYGDTQLKGNEALVEVAVVNPDEGQVAIGFRLNQSDGVWKIWDVRFDGVSMAGNLRKQVQSLMTKQSYEELVKRMQQKIEDAAAS